MMQYFFYILGNVWVASLHMCGLQNMVFFFLISLLSFFLSFFFFEQGGEGGEGEE
jgi:hypothetical protein